MQASVKGPDAPGDPGARGAEGGVLTPLELRAWRGMLSAHAGLVRRLDADLRAAHGLSLTSYEALMLLGTSPRGRMRISELSTATLLSVSGMSRMVDRLVREGLAVRESCEEDGRGAEVALTPGGRRLPAGGARGPSGRGAARVPRPLLRRRTRRHGRFLGTDRARWTRGLSPDPGRRSTGGAPDSSSRRAEAGRAGPHDPSRRRGRFSAIWSQGQSPPIPPPPGYAAVDPAGPGVTML